MGLFNRKGKKDKVEEIVLEQCKGGYILKGLKPARSPRISSVWVFCSSATPLKDEREMLKGIIKEFNLAGDIAPEAIISVVYEVVPDIDGYLSTQEMPESLNAFIMTRAMMKGLARSQAEMGRLAVNPFNVKGVKGVLVLKET
jgi:hypothetical protein